MILRELLPDSSTLMGVKAVFGLVTSRVMCFGSRGDRATEPGRHYQAARSVAEKAMERRWMITIGGGSDVPSELRGRALNLVSVSSTYGETTAFVEDVDERARLMQWPTSVALRDIYDIVGFPHLVSDLGFDNLRSLENAFDQVVRPEPRVEELWNALRDTEIRLRDVPPIIGFNDQDKLTLASTFLPRKISKEEGKRLRKEAIVLERDPSLSSEAKRVNAMRNGGVHVCEGCEFSNKDGSLFDAHHLVPLALKVRLSGPSDLAVLCPTCHRVCHRYGFSDAVPLPVAGIRSWWQQGGSVP